MRVSELANELGKSSKEVLDIVKQKDQSASLFAASSLSGDQEAMVRAAVNQKKKRLRQKAEQRQSLQRRSLLLYSVPRTHSSS